MRMLMFTGLMLCFLFNTGCNKLPEEYEQAYSGLPEEIDFNIHVKPILSDKCFHCHGPDENTRKANFRLDDPEEVFHALSDGSHALVKGRPFSSKLVQRIISEEPEFKMPPPESKLSLSQEEIAILIKWVEQGAVYKPHWSFIAPEKREIPQNIPETWRVTNEIDAFVYEKINNSGLKPSPQADRETLIRRVSLDLTGLPPTPEEIDSFLRDTSPDAYEKVVNRLLGSDAHAERMAMEWLDVARYADSHGMHADGYRLMWPWRDWVISAFKRNMPYNEFVTWQLAGDLLPDHSREQKLATAFNRNHPMTDEGGVIAEEFRLKYVADRTITISTAMLGLTMECASCHDHKFDPISQKEFYGLSAFFNNVNELGMIGADGNFGPMLLLTDSTTEEKLSALNRYITSLENQLDTPAVAIQQSAVSPSGGSLPSLHSPPVARYAFEKFSPDGKGRFYLDNNKRSYVKKEPELVAGIKGKAMKLRGEYDELYLAGIGFYEQYDAFSVGAWINTGKLEEGKTQTIVGNSGQKNNYWRGWDFILDDQNRVNVRLISALPNNYIQVSSKDSVSRDTWTHVLFTYDGSGSAKGITIYMNGEPVETTIVYDNLYKSILPLKIAYKIVDPRPLMVGKSYRLHTGEFGIFKGLIDDITIFDRVLSPVEARITGLLPDQKISGDSFTREELKRHHLQKDPVYQQQRKEIRESRRKKLELMEQVDEVMVMEELPVPRETFVLERGDYSSPGEVVHPETPEAILPFPDELPANRLGLAQWMFHEDNPLTARVTVNRYWQMIFGRGLVGTANDFGNQGALPTHPELLDYLAVEFRESGWDVRDLIRKMVMSSVYRQSSVLTSELKETDPQNLLLARSPSYRYPAEIIRDNALAISGLLVRKVGGESVKPYQPEGLWRELSNYSKELLTYERDTGEKLYRRSMYTFIRRSSPPPFMTIFDAPNRDVCTVTRERTNTPLQALVILNDTQFVEASKALADRMLQMKLKSGSDPLPWAFRLATGRMPGQKELNVLEELYAGQLEFYQANREEADKLLAVGEYQMIHAEDPAQAAALSMVANTLMNHDAIYMKR